MSELILTRDEKLAHRSAAHHVNFTVLLGNAGLTQAVLKEIDRALAAHGLIKVKVPGDDRQERETIYETLADELGAARIQAIGKTLVLYRPVEEKEVKIPPKKAEKKQASKKPGDKKPRKAKKALPPPKPRHPKAKRLTKKAALSKR